MEFHNIIVAEMMLWDVLGVKSEAVMLDLFLDDKMQYGLGTEIRIEVLDAPHQLTKEDRDKIARSIVKVVSSCLPEGRKVFCRVYRTDPEDGYFVFER